MNTNALISTLASIGEALAAVQEAVLHLSVDDQSSCQAQLDVATNAMAEGAEAFERFAKSCPSND